MSLGGEGIALALPESQLVHPTVRIAHYTGYPRVSKNQRECTAIARKTRSSALCLVAAESEVVGALLRLNLCDLNTVHASETLARVVSCSVRDDGRFDVRVEPVEPNRPRFVRRSLEARRHEG